MEENTSQVNQTCQKCGRNAEKSKTCKTCNSKPKEEKKKCDKCEKLKKGVTPYVLLSIVVFTFLVYGIYKAVADIIGLFTH